MAFSWSGLPQFAAWLIRDAIARHGDPCAVVGTRPEVPISGMEEALGQRITWIARRAAPTWQDLGEPVPDVFVQCGWATPAFNALGREVREAGGAVILTADFCWRGDFRQRVLAPIAYRVLYRRAFDAVIVAGASGTRFARYLGVPADRIRQGMLGASADIFCGGDPLKHRTKELLFVGRMIELKGLDLLLTAFSRVAPAHPDLTLRICGSGPLAASIPQHPQITSEGFLQPQQLVERYRQARALVLPSRREPWGLVVHEAALCGCALILSEAVGSAADLAGAGNALLVRPGDAGSLAGAIADFAAWDERRLLDAERESRRLAVRFGPERFSEALLDLVERVRPSERSPSSRIEGIV